MLASEKVPLRNRQPEGRGVDRLIPGRGRRVERELRCRWKDDRLRPDGRLRLLEVQPAGGRVMSGAAYRRGRPGLLGSRVGAPA